MLVKRLSRVIVCAVVAVLSFSCIAASRILAQAGGDAPSSTWDTPLSRSLTLQVLPKLLVFTPAAASATVTFNNPGDSLLEATVRVVFYVPRTDSAGKVRTEAVFNPDSAAPSAAAWIAGVPTHVVLRPHQQVEIPITLEAPKNLKDGDYRALIWATSTRTVVLPAPGDRSPTPGLASMTATLNDQVIVVYRQGGSTTAAAMKAAFPYAEGAPVFARTSAGKTQRRDTRDTTVGRSTESLYDVLAHTGRFRTFLSLAELAGLDAPLRAVMPRSQGASGLEVRESVQLRIGRSAEPEAAVTRLQRELGENVFDGALGITLFAPTDSAFAALSPDTLAAIRRDTLRAVRLVRMHIAPAFYTPRGLTEYLSRVQAMDGSALSVDEMGALTVVSRAPVVEHQFQSPRGVATVHGPPVVARNGLLYQIDRLMGIP